MISDYTLSLLFCVFSDILMFSVNVCVLVSDHTLSLLFCVVSVNLMFSVNI